MSTNAPPTPPAPAQSMGFDAAGRLWLDGSSLTDFLHCSRRWFIKHVLRRTTTGTSPALDFGSAWHRVMELHNKHGRLDSAAIAAVAADFHLIDTEDHRNFPMLDAAYTKWLSLEHADFQPYLVDGKPVIEGAFSFPLTDSIMWCGKIDRLVQLANGKPAVIDYKTSSADSQQFWGAFEADLAQTGYLWAATQAMGTMVDTFIIQAHFTYKVPRAADVMFKERIYIRDHRVFTEWREMICHAAATMSDLYSVAADFSAEDVLCNGAHANRAACYAHKYGPCPYISICNMPDPAARRPILNGLGFQDYRWSPLAGGDA